MGKSKVILLIEDNKITVEIESGTIEVKQPSLFAKDPHITPIPPPPQEQKHLSEKQIATLLVNGHTKGEILTMSYDEGVTLVAKYLAEYYAKRGISSEENGKKKRGRPKKTLL